MFLWILVSIIVFSVIVLVHEYWHFKTARMFWVKVFEFGLGIPPKAKKLWTDKHWTEYTLNWLPIWGFVRMKWENINQFQIYDKNKKIIKQEELKKILKSENETFDIDWIMLTNDDKKMVLDKLKENEDKDNLINKPYWQQSIIVLAWVFMNFLFAIIIFTVLFTIWVKPIWINDKIDTNLDIMMFPTIEQSIEKWLLEINPWILLYPLTWSLAEKSWIKENDLLLKINWNKVNDPDSVKDFISKNKWSQVVFDVDRKGKIEVISLNIWEDWKIWTYLWPNYGFNKDFIYKYNFIDAIKVSTKEVYNETLLTFKALWILVTKLVLPKTKQDREEAIESVWWPIAVVWVIQDAMKVWFNIVLILAALISINLWAFNLLPIPALDWWRFALSTINVIIRKLTWKKWIPPYFEWLIHLSFFVILIFLSIIVAYNDVIKIIEK